MTEASVREYDRAKLGGYGVSFGVLAMGMNTGFAR